MASESTSEGGLEQIRRIELAQRLKTYHATGLTVMVGQVLASAFIWGHGQGPMRPSAIEVLGLMLAALLLSLLVAPFVVRRRVREGAAYAGRVSEGSHRRKLIVFEDAAILDGEVVPYGLVDTCRLDDTDPSAASLHLRSQDVRHGGPVLRDLSGPAEALRRVAARAEAARSEVGRSEAGRAEAARSDAAGEGPGGPRGDAAEGADASTGTDRSSPPSSGGGPPTR